MKRKVIICRTLNNETVHVISRKKFNTLDEAIAYYDIRENQGESVIGFVDGYIEVLNKGK